MSNVYKVNKYILFFVIKIFLFNFIFNSAYSMSVYNMNDVNWQDVFKQVENPEALNWVKNQNNVTKSKLDTSLEFNKLYSQTFDILTSPDRIAYPSIGHDGKYYNFWQDDKSIRGKIRVTTKENYINSNNLNTDNIWETVLDFDKLAEQESKNWIYSGNIKGYFNYVDTNPNNINSINNVNNKVLIKLSDGGKDASELREFDYSKKQFVDNGFYLPEAKSYVSWYDANNLLVATNFGDDSLSESGYPIEVRLLQRGQELNKAKKIYAGNKQDMLVLPETYYSIDINTKININYIITRAKDFYHYEYYLYKNDELVRINISEEAKLHGVFDNSLIFSLKEKWVYNNVEYPADSIVALGLENIDNFGNLVPVLIFTANDKQAIENIAIAKSRIYLHLLDNVNGKLFEITVNNNSYKTYNIKKLDIPKFGAVNIISSNWYTDELIFNYENFLTPSKLYYYNPNDIILDDKNIKTNIITLLKELPPKFNTNNLIVKQKFTTSDDGTKIPYYLVHKKDLIYNNTTPTLLYGYGGFEVALTPSYSAVLGKNWLEKGNAYVLANIRGGGEYGSKWHKAAILNKRHKAFEDFSSIAKDLINNKITSAKHLAIQGGSNGGLLMGVMLTKYPDLFNGIVCSVPLLDMLEYSTLLAGASWMAEYGDPKDPDSSGIKEYLASYSPLQNLEFNQNYPEIFIQTSTKDDRVHPYHARIMAHTMQAMGYANYYYEDIDGGHSSGANLIKKAENLARTYVYLLDKTS